MNYITYPSALDFWLNGTGRLYPKQFIYEDFDPIAASGCANESILPSLPAPVTIMVASQNKRHENLHFRYVAVHSNFPRQSFVRIGSDVCVASPELCFMLAYKDYPLSQLVELGNALCAGYVYDAGKPYFQRSRTPITSAERIRNFLDGAYSCCGVRKASVAAKYIRDNAWSLMETRFAVGFFLPNLYGGFGINGGVLNGEPELTEKAYDILGSRKCRGDITWNESKSVCEYDSTMTHGNQEQLQYDARRQTAMNLSGYKIVRFTAETLHSFSKYEDRTLALCENLGMKNRPKVLEKYRSRRLEVFKELFVMPHSFFRQ